MVRVAERDQRALGGVTVRPLPPEVEQARRVLDAMADATRQQAGDASSAPLAALDPDVSAQAKFQTLVEQIPAITFSAAFAGGLKELYVSPQIEEIMGYSRQEWVDSPVLWYERLHPDDKMRWNREFAQTLAQGKPFKAVYRFLSKDDRVVWLHGEARVIRDARGTPMLLQGVGFDVTEVYEAQLRVQEAEARAKQALEQEVRERTRELAAYRHLVDSSTDAIARLRADGSLDSWNDRATALFGLVVEHRGQLRLSDLVTDAGVSKRLAEAVAAHRACAAETIWTTPSGEELDLSISLSPIFDDEQELRGMSAIIRDATDSRRAARRFQLAVEAAPNAMIIVDESSRITLANSEAERLFGYTRAELLGRPVDLLVPERARAEHPRLRRAFAASPQARGMGRGRDLSARRKDGSEVPVEIGLNPIHTGDGTLVLCAVVDISERKRSEQIISETNQALRAKSAEMEQFLYTVSHDLKSPLVTVGSFLGVLQEDLDSGDRNGVADAMRRMRNAVTRMQTLIDDLLELSRVGTVELELTDVDLTEVLQDVVDALEEPLSGAGLRVEHIQPLPTVRGDRARLFQVLENVLANAAKYAATAAAPRVVVTAEQRPDSKLVKLDDNGPGIPPEHSARIFKLFQRLDSHASGTGIGLTIVARIMQMHGGRVWVEQGVEGGACFVLAFPSPPSGTGTKKGR